MEGHFFKRFYLFIFRGEGREKEERNIDVWEIRTPTGDLTRNPGLGPDGESNQRPFGSQASTQSTEPHQPWLIFKLKKKTLQINITECNITHS